MQPGASGVMHRQAFVGRLLRGLAEHRASCRQRRVNDELRKPCDCDCPLGLPFDSESIRVTASLIASEPQVEIATEN